jgi:hypothetical protein
VMVTKYFQLISSLLAKPSGRIVMVIALSIGARIFFNK